MSRISGLRNGMNKRAFYKERRINKRYIHSLSKQNIKAPLILDMYEKREGKKEGKKLMNFISEKKFNFADFKNRGTCVLIKTLKGGRDFNFICSDSLRIIKIKVEMNIYIVNNIIIY